jgi:hypothetical protein
MLTITMKSLIASAFLILLAGIASAFTVSTANAQSKKRTMVPATVIVSQFLQTFEAFPPSQKSGGLTVSQFLDAVQKGASGAGK